MRRLMLALAVFAGFGVTRRLPESKSGLACKPKAWAISPAKVDCIWISVVIIALIPGCSSPLENAMNYWSSGYQKAKSGDHEGAIADYSKSINSLPTFVDGYRSRSVERLQKGDYDGAISDSTKCIDLNANEADNEMCYANRAAAFKAKGDLVNANSDEKTVRAFSDALSSRTNAIRASARHYTSGQPIPGVGTAMGDVYILPDGGCFGERGSGIQWTNGARMYFGPSVGALLPIHLVQPGSPATK